MTASASLREGEYAPLLVNLGCGLNVAEGWVNVDTAIGARLAQLPLVGKASCALRIVRAPWPRGIIIHDLRKPLPWQDACVDGIYLSHVLEHFSKLQGRRLLFECSRVLRRQGVLRVVVPDLRAIAEEYVHGSTDARDFLGKLNATGSVDTDGALKQRVGWLFRFPHRCMYDSAALTSALREAGFTATVCSPFEGTLQDLDAVEVDYGGTVIAEGTRPK
jgi:hypothetical protein